MGEEVAACTFRPKLTPRAQRTSHEPRNYREAVHRMRRGSEMRERQKQLEEHVPRGENYARLRALPPAPPVLGGTSRSRPKPFLILEVHVGFGRKGHLPLRIDDDAAIVAAKFGKVYGLSKDHQAKLVRIITEQIEAAKAESVAEGSELGQTQNR